MKLVTWTMKLALECPKGVSAEEYAAKLRRTGMSGSVLVDSDVQILVYTGVAAFSVREALVTVEDALQAVLGEFGKVQIARAEVFA